VSKFSIINYESGDSICECQELLGMMGEDQKLDSNGTRKHKVDLIGVNFTDHSNPVDMNFTKRKFEINSIDINVIDKNSTILGQYGMGVFESIPYLNQKNQINVQLLGLVEVSRRHEIKLWDILRSGKPSTNGIWHKMSYSERRAWLNIIRKYFICGNTQQKSIQKQSIIEIDGKYIFDSSSFFLSFGEAVNGPCGYFGAEFSGFADCISGIDSSVKNSPFVLKWHNSELSKKYLDKNSVLIEAVDCAADSARELNSVGEIPEIRDYSLIEVKTMFDLLIEIMGENGIDVELL